MKWDSFSGGNAANSWATFHFYTSNNDELCGIGNEYYSSNISTYREAGVGSGGRESGTVVQTGVDYTFTLTITYHAWGPDTAVLDGGGFNHQALAAGDWGFDHIRVRAGNGANQVDFTNMSMTSTGTAFVFDPQTVPEPVFPDPAYKNLYWTAWELAYAHIKGQAGLPQTPYMDEAFWDDTIWIWDTAFMTFFTEYSPEVFPGVQSLNSFYVPMHDGISIPLKIQHPDNPPLFAWSEYANWRLNNKLSSGSGTFSNLTTSLDYLTKHYDWFDAAIPGQNWGGVNTVFWRAEQPGGNLKGFGWNNVASGMDNTPRGRNAGGSTLWVDAISQQALSALYISRLASAKGDAATAASWMDTYNQLKTTINQYYWNAADGIYYDINNNTDAQDPVETPASFWPMLAEVCSQDQALDLVQHVRTQTDMGGKIPWTTVARNDVDFNRQNGNYWRGAVWLPTAYMGVKALETYGYQKLADETAAGVLAHMVKTYQDYSPATIWECYNPRLPEPAYHNGILVRPDFCGWSALGPISLFIQNMLGFYDVDGQSNTVHWRLHQPGEHGIRRLKFGATTADIVTDGAGNVTVDTDNPFTLVINGTSYDITNAHTVIAGIVLPQAPQPTQRIEAEDGTFGNTWTEATIANYSGTSYVVGFNGNGTETITLNVASPRTGTFPVSLCYTRSWGSNGKLDIKANGNPAQTLTLTDGGSWSRWMWTRSVELSLNEGTNTVVISNPYGLDGDCVVDCIEINYNNQSPTGCTLSQTNLPPGLPAGTVVAQISSYDPDAGDVLRNLVEVGSDNFKVMDDKLVLVHRLANGSYPLTLRTADWDGAYKDSSFTITVAGPTSVNIDGSVEGRVFDGIGAVSAGASSRLLMDYPSIQQSQILDYLFKPNYGASFQHLKVEIGSDANSTDGTEPSVARTKSEYDNPAAAYFNRGYEYWLMKEAKARNGSIYLDCLEWGAPGWIGNIYSTNNINYLLAFIKGAKTYHNLDIDFVGTWNERPNYSPAGLNFVKDLRMALNNNNLSAVKIAGIDAVNDWSISTYVNNDPALKSALAAIAVHYPAGLGINAANSIGWNYGNNTGAQNTGLPLYSSEDGPWSGTWDGAKAIARLNNRNYIKNRITKTEYWSPVSSYYDVLSIPGSGVMYANQPWSGHYDVQPAVWAVAHTTQFARPGWKYVDSGCGLLDGGNGSYVTLKKPDGSGDYSIIAETTGCATSQTVTINLSNLSAGTVHVWKSDPTNQFIQQADITPSNGSFSITMEPQTIYSLTTTTGQVKGAAASPSSAPFPSSYADDFESYGVGATPKYFADQVGAFEVYQAAGETKALRQVITNRPITWVNDAWPHTILGDQNLADYDVSTSALIEGTTGQVGLLGKVSAVPGYEQGIEPNGYGLYVHESGSWVLRKRGTTLATGAVPFSANTWHTLRFSFANDNIRAYIDGVQIVSLNDSTYPSGLAGLATDWNNARFDQFAIAVVNPNQASIMWSAGGGILSLSWPDHPGWILQHQSNSVNVGLSNNWVDVSGSEHIIATTISISGVGSAMFYRLRHP